MPPAPRRSCSPMRRSCRSKRAPKPAQRVAFVYYVLGLDLDARRVADTWRQGATGEWASQAAWISGLASWRLGDCNAASAAFQQVAALAPQRELRPAAIIGPRAPSRPPAGRARSKRCCASAREIAGKLLRPARPRNARPVDQARRRSVHRQRSAGRPAAQRPARGRARADRRAARWPRKCSATRPRSASPPSIMR